MDDTSSAWLDDPGQEPAAVMNVHAICPNCAEPVRNPVPVIVTTPNAMEAWCICANEHVWITRFVPSPTTPESESAA